jgi:hypothetical protein
LGWVFGRRGGRASGSLHQCDKNQIKHFKPFVAGPVLARQRSDHVVLTDGVRFKVIATMGATTK